MPKSKLAADTINAFRSGQELASSNTTQLRKTIAELEERIHAQDLLIEEQKQAIVEREAETQDLAYELDVLCGAIYDPRHTGQVLARELQDGYKQYARIQQLTKANEKLVNFLEELEDAFQHIITKIGPSQAAFHIFCLGNRPILLKVDRGWDLLIRYMIRRSRDMIHRSRHMIWYFI
jgi:uncharacterized coiled-coil protein SlyX